MHPEPSRLDATVDATHSVYMVGNRAGLSALAEALTRGVGRLRLVPPEGDVGPGASAMSALKITATDGLIVVSSHDEILRIEGELELLQSIASTVERMLEGLFWSADFEPYDYQGVARSSLSLKIALERSERPGT